MITKLQKKQRLLILKFGGKFKKKFNKCSYKGGKKYFEVNNYLYKKVIFEFCKIFYLLRKAIYYFIFKFHKTPNIRNFFMIKNYAIHNKFSFLKYLFYNISWSSIIAFQYGKLLESHLELMRRKFKQNLGKYVLIELCVKPYKILLKRPNQVRMGGGKANKFWKIIYPVYPGLELIRIKGSLFKYVFSLFKTFKNKLPFDIRCVLINRF